MKYIGVFLIAGVIILGFEAVWSLGDLRPGENAKVASETLACAEPDYCGEYQRAEDLGDDFGISHLLGDGRVRILTEGTELLVIEAPLTRWFWRRVRVLNGPLAGEALWVRNSPFE